MDEPNLIPDLGFLNPVSFKGWWAGNMQMLEVLQCLAVGTTTPQKKSMAFDITAYMVLYVQGEGLRKVHTVNVCARAAPKIGGKE